MVSNVSHAENGLVREFLRDRTIGCPACRYNLRGAAGESCPECGAELELHLVSADIRLGWWLARVLALALPLGFSAILAGAAAFGAWRSVYWTESDWWTLGALCVLTLFYSMGLLGIVRGRSKFLRKPRLEQRVRSIGLALIMLGLQVLLFYLYQRLGRA
jgi:hypothetical protein